MPISLATLDEAPDIGTTGFHAIDHRIERVKRPENAVVGEQDAVGAVGTPLTNEVLPRAEVEPGVLAMEHGGAGRFKRAAIRFGRWRRARAGDESLVAA